MNEKSATSVLSRAESTEDVSSEEPTSKVGRRLRIVAALAVVLAGLAVWFGIEANAEVGQADPSNSALVDLAGTSQVNNQVGAALDKVFSYRYANPSATAQAADQLLSGQARTQYDTLFAVVRQQAPAQQLVLTSKTVLSGVRMLDGDHAALLAFVDQHATRGDTKVTGTGAAQLSITAEKTAGTWKITGLQAR